jgi:hypothetical protein
MAEHSLAGSLDVADCLGKASDLIEGSCYNSRPAGPGQGDLWRRCRLEEVR